MVWWSKPINISLKNTHKLSLLIYVRAGITDHMQMKLSEVSCFSTIILNFRALLRYDQCMRTTHIDVENFMSFHKYPSIKASLQQR